MLGFVPRRSAPAAAATAEAAFAEEPSSDAFQAARRRPRATRLSRLPSASRRTRGWRRRERRPSKLPRKHRKLNGDPGSLAAETATEEPRAVTESFSGPSKTLTSTPWRNSRGVQVAKVDEYAASGWAAAGEPCDAMSAPLSVSASRQTRPDLPTGSPAVGGGHKAAPAPPLLSAQNMALPNCVPDVEVVFARGAGATCIGSVGGLFVDARAPRLAPSHWGPCRANYSRQ